MGGIRQRGTSAEREVAAIVYRLGYRYRLNNRDLPGSPDLANRRCKWAIYVHGCFWHGHQECPRATVPKRNRAFWADKFDANRTRDARVTRQMKALGFVVITIWECQVAKAPGLVEARLRRRLTQARGNLDS
jgi:DNA mismatch endonuclease, patch repair protein